MSNAAAAAPKSSGSLDIDFHESTHSRDIRKVMSTRHLLPTRQDDLLRSGSTHQLLTRPTPSAGASLLSMPVPPRRPAPAGAAESLATEDTVEESDSEDSGGSFCDASGDCAADRDYLRKDLGASLHEDDLDFESGDEKTKEMAGDTDDDDDDELIREVKNRMKLEEEAKQASS